MARTTAAIRTGALVIGGGGELPPVIIDRFLELGGGPDAKLVVISTASMCAEWPEADQPHQRLWASRPLASKVILHTRDPKIADTEDFCRTLETATAVWFVGGDQNQVTRTYCGTHTESCLHGVLRRGGVIGGTSAGAAIMSRVMITGGRTDPNLGDGLGFLPGTIIDQHFLKRNRQPRLMAALQQRPGHVGIGIDESTAVVVRRNSLEVIGNSEAALCLAESHNRPAMVQPIKSGETLDLETWRLAATARARFGSYAQAEQRPAPNLRQGAVVITSGQAPKEAVAEFLAAAGGKDARVVLVSQTSEGNATSRQQLAADFRSAGAENVTVCEANSLDELLDPTVSELLAAASGVWLVGDHEQQFLDLVLHSPLRQMVNDVLDRGGAIGGSLAAARLQGDGIIRRKPADDEQSLMAEAYECGLGLLTGMVIDDQDDPEPEDSTMATALRERFPNCVGVGLKDSSAVVVRGHTLQVVGSNPVSVRGRSSQPDEAKSSYELVQVGQMYDLRARRVMPTEAADEDTATR
ncbi:MAG TPA: cyanophycinase [Planctomycetaceae bacterium]|nr:cyanophycinase [Planctomycetaceae bacterium]